MPRYRFRWENIDAVVLRSLHPEDNTPVTTIRATYGARPKVKFVAAHWPALRDVWLPRSPDRCLRVVSLLRVAGLGRADIDVSTPEGQAEYLMSCRNSTTLRSIVLEEFIASGEDPPPLTKPERTSVSWPSFEKTLAAGLASLAAGQFLIVSVKGTGVAQGHGETGETGAPYFVQFASEGEHGFRAEAVSNNYLVGDERLDYDTERALVAHGWLEPNFSADATPSEDADGSPNYYLDWPTPDAVSEIAGLAASTLRDVYHVPHPGFLRYTALNADGSEFDLPALEIKRDTPDPPSVDEGVARLALTRPQSPDELRGAVLATLRSVLDGGELVVDSDGDIPINWGSASVYVRVLEDRPMVRIVSPVLSGVRSSHALLEAINELNRDHILVSACWTGDAVVLTGDLFASPYVAETFLNVLHVVAEVADAIDEELQSRFAGAVDGGRGFGGYL